MNIILDQFVATLYCKDVAELGHTRLDMFLHSATNDFRKLLLSRRSLEQYVLRGVHIRQDGNGATHYLVQLPCQSMSGVGNSIQLKMNQ